MAPKHAWNRLTNLTGDLAVDYAAVQSYIQRAVDKGTKFVEGVNERGEAIVRYETVINGETVIAKGIELANRVFQISDAWVKTR